jgi:hypothetical protein
VPVVAARSARPAIPVAAALMLIGAAVVVIGCALTWVSWPSEAPVFGPREWNGFTEVLGERNDGIAFTVMAVIIAAFGVTSLAAKRVLPVVIIGLVVAGFGFVAAIADLADISDFDEVAAPWQPEIGAGLPVVIVGFALTIAGFIAGIAKRRRSPA